MPEFHTLASFLLLSWNRKKHWIMEKEIKNEEVNEEIVNEEQEAADVKAEAPEEKEKKEQ